MNDSCLLGAAPEANWKTCATRSRRKSKAAPSRHYLPARTSFPELRSDSYTLTLGPVLPRARAEALKARIVPGTGAPFRPLGAGSAGANSRRGPCN